VTTLVSTPLPVRIIAYILGLVAAGIGGPTVVYLLTTGTVTSAQATLITAGLALVGTLSGTLALSHLSLPDSSPAPVIVYGTDNATVTRGE